MITYKLETTQPTRLFPNALVISSAQEDVCAKEHFYINELVSCESSPL